jgi:diguanylate cyclase (GGDEF)-like protein/PAS domain S-box-containing protein
VAQARIEECPRPGSSTTDAGWMLDLLSEPVNRFRISDRTITYCNQAWADHYLVSPTAAVGRCLDEFLSPDELDGLRAQLELIGPHNPVVADSVARVDGGAGAEQRWLQWVDHYVITDTGPEVMSVGHDVTERHLTRLALAESERRFRVFADASSDIVWRLRGPVVHFDYMSPSVERILGFAPAHFLDEFDNFMAIAEPDTRELIDGLRCGGQLPERFDLRFRRADGTVVVIETSVTISDDAIHGVGRDVTEIRELQSALSALASTDALTGLTNRRGFDQALTSALAQTGAARAALAVVYLDLDDLKSVNDRYGHRSGDVVLQEAARRLAASAGEADLVARLGGDEFAIIHEIEGDSVSRLVERLDDRMRAPIHLTSSVSVTCTASIGVADTSTHGRLADALLTAADRAMYVSKQHHCRR